LQNNKIIKLTGPSGIGKSFFLLYLSRTSNNYLYLNLSVLNKLFNDNQNVKLINMIIIELNRLKLSDKIKIELNKYFEELNTVDLDSIIKYLINIFIQQNDFIKIIMDQFKTKYFKSWEDFEIYFKNSASNIKLIICSSINDHNIRDSVVRSINNNIKTEKITKSKDGAKEKSKILNSEYFYISNLFDIESLNQLYNSEGGIGIKTENNFIYESFDYIPKYVFKINKADDVSLKIIEITDLIKQKFQDFYKLDKDDMNLKLKLSSLRRYIGQIFPIKDFNKITSNFYFKYFIMKFYTNEGEVDFIKEEMPIISFQIDYAFSLISEIIEEMALESNDLFFDNGIYKEHTGSTIGGYFELIAIDKIKKKIISLPNNNFEYIINTDRINEMNIIKLRLSNLINNNLEILKGMMENKQEENSLLNKDKDINTEKSINPFKEVDNNGITMKEIKEKENNLLNKDENVENPKNINSFKEIDINKMNIENLFEEKIHPQFEESEKINFDANFLVQNSTINQIKNFFIKENNARFYNDSGNLLFSTRLFETARDKVKRFKPKISNNINSIDINYHFLKDKNILITQYYENAPSFDLGYLYGEGDKKVFLGFQMKSYKDYFDNNRTFPISRETILKQSQLLLFNSKLLLDIDIVQLNYVIVGLYFKNETNLKDNISYSEDLIQFCEKNKFKLLLYDPFEKKFLDNNKNYINEIRIPDRYINLLNDEEILPFEGSQNNFLQRKTNRQLENELMELTKKANNILDNEKKLTLNHLKTFVELIKKDLNLSKLKYAGSCRLVSSYNLLVPKDGYMFLFYKNNHEEMEGLNKFYAFAQDAKKNFFLYDFQTKQNLYFEFIFSYFNLFNTKEKYYIFKLEKKNI
jgi:hypothetical protein